MNVPSWEHFSHDADIGIRGYGNTINEAFEQGALAMTAVISDPKAIADKDAVEVVCEESDIELLFIDWLNALVYEMATRHMLFSKFQVNITNGKLQGNALGEKVSVPKHKPIVEVKGATYTALKVKQDNNGIWIAQSIIDI